MVTARNEQPDIVVALEMGADDYLVRPVSLRQPPAILMRHPDRVFTRLLWLRAAGDCFAEYRRTVDSHISHARKQRTPPDVIQTLREVGCQLVPSVRMPHLGLAGLHDDNAGCAGVAAVP